jgi:hypothetical protein
VQKFGLQRNSSGLPNAIELELVKEQATSLGRAGRKLRLSLEAYNELLNEQPSDSGELKLIHEISANVWELMVQREFIGFIEGNLQWVKQNYLIPEKAIKLLGYAR